MPLRTTRAPWFNPMFAPDGDRLAVQIIGEGQNDIWVYDWARDRRTNVTSHPADDTKPVWSLDGRGMVFASTRGDKTTSNLCWQRADGTGEPRRLTGQQERAATRLVASERQVPSL